MPFARVLDIAWIDVDADNTLEPAGLDSLQSVSTRASDGGKTGRRDLFTPPD
jgi:hypothetical protein